MTGHPLPRALRKLPPARTAAIWGSAFLLAVSFLNLLWPLLLAPMRFPLMPNEGWNALHAAAALGSGPLYPGAESYMFNNYPPLSFYITGAAGRLIGDNLLAGRALSLLSMLIVAWNIAQTTRNLGGSLACGVFAGLLWIGILSKSYVMYIGVADPQLLGQAIMATGLSIFTASPKRPGHICAAALVMVLAGFTKHNLFAMPLAVTLWLALHDRRSLAHWLAWAALFLAIGFGLCGLVHGREFFDQMLTPRQYDAGQVIALLGWFQGFVISLVLWVLFVRSTPAEPKFSLVTSLLAASALEFAVTRLGVGVGINSLMDLVLAASLATGVLLSDAGKSAYAARWGGDAVSAAIVALLCLRMVLLPATNFLIFAASPVAIVHDWHAREKLYSADIRFLRAQAGPSICEDLALCYWAGHASNYDVFNAQQSFQAGTRSLEKLRADIAARKYPVVQLYGNSPLLDAARKSGLKESRGAADGHIFFTPG